MNLKIFKFWDNFGIYVIALITFSVFAILTPLIISPDNIINLLSQISMVAIAAVGMTFAITAGGFDLSVGSILAISTCVICTNIPILGLWPSIGINFLVATVLGAINGIIITKFKIQTFVATLATMIIYRGLALIYTQGHDSQIYGYLDIKVFSSGRFLFIPVPVLIMFSVFALGYILYKYFPFGTFVRSIGSNIDAARISGIKVDKNLIIVFILTALTTSVAGIILSSRLLTGNGRLGGGFELEVITATILGGTSLAGGKGNIWGTLVAAIMLGIIKNGLNLLGVPDFYQRLATGLILILALAINGINLRLKEKTT